MPDKDDDDDFLYAALEVPGGASSVELQDKLRESERMRAALQAALDRANSEKSELQKVNQILERNIGVLFNTAKAEIDRKDRRIEELERRHQPN